MAWTSLGFVYGSVLTSTKMTQNQDNFTAVAHGLSGAPKVLNKAFSPVVVGSVSILGGMSIPSNGNVTTVASDTSGAYSELFNFRVNHEGAYRIKHTSNGTAPQWYTRLDKNGAAISSHTNTSTSPLFDDVSSCMVGDTIQLYGRSYIGGSYVSVYDVGFMISAVGSENFIPPVCLTTGAR
mgnify:CR=1 FL=1